MPWAFYDGVMALVDRGRVARVTCLDFCKAFDFVLRRILLSKLERCGFEEGFVGWVRNGLVGHSQRVCEWLSVRVEAGLEQCPSGGLSWDQCFSSSSSVTDGGIKCTLSKFVDDTKLSFSYVFRKLLFCS